VFFNLFAAAQPSANVCVARAKPVCRRCHWTVENTTNTA